MVLSSLSSSLSSSETVTAFFASKSTGYYILLGEEKYNYIESSLESILTGILTSVSAGTKIAICRAQLFHLCSIPQKTEMPLKFCSWGRNRIVAGILGCWGRGRGWGCHAPLTEILVFVELLVWIQGTYFSKLGKSTLFTWIIIVVQYRGYYG